MSELETMAQHLRQPEYIHVLLNPLPIYGLAMGALVLALELFRRQGGPPLAGLISVAVACLSAWPASHYGHMGYDRVYAMSNGDAQQWLELHAERAGWAVYIYYAAGALAIAAIALRGRIPRLATILSVATLLVAVISLGFGGWAAHAAGQVRHSEFRDGPPAVRAEPHHHGPGAQGHDH